MSSYHPTPNTQISANEASILPCSMPGRCEGVTSNFRSTHLIQLSITFSLSPLASHLASDAILKLFGVYF